jgi:hypothetical protein
MSFSWFWSLPLRLFTSGDSTVGEVGYLVGLPGPGEDREVEFSMAENPKLLNIESLDFSELFADIEGTSEGCEFDDLISSFTLFSALRTPEAELEAMGEDESVSTGGLPSPSCKLSRENLDASCVSCENIA